MRWLLIISSVVAAAVLGLFAGYARWGKQEAKVEHVEQQLQTTTSELTTLRQERAALQQRLEQVNKEQERLAQENEILRTQRTTQQLLGGKGGELPELPPK